MSSLPPVYCADCEYLAIAKVDKIPYCGNCLEKKTMHQSPGKLVKRSEPLRVVKHPQLGPPDMDKLKY